jgi:sulfate adenylyltransferase large subunit
MEKEPTEFLKFVIVGHVDHGKSTLIGRMLYDTDSLPEGKMEDIKKASAEKGKEAEFAYLLDALEEEMEQGITIDTTQIWFKTDKRQYVIIDAPGHKEFLKNMITGASQAEAAILIVDAEEGVRENTKRHAYILGMLGIKQVTVVMNKMDLVEYKEERYKEVRDELEQFLEKLSIKPSYVIPISAKEGENVARKSDKMDWYKGKTVLESLDTFEKLKPISDKALRYPVQDVYKINDKRIFVGRVESGTIKEGQDIMFYPEKNESKVKTVEKFQEEPTEAEAGESIGITLDDALFIDRGHIGFNKGEEPRMENELEVTVFWMSKKELKKGDLLAIQLATQEVTLKVEEIHKRMDSSTLEIIEEDAEILKNTEVGTLKVKSEKPIIFDKFTEIPTMGRFVLVKENDVVAGGIIN